MPWVLGGAVALAALLAGLLWPQEPRVAIKAAYRIDESTLLVYGNSGDDTDVRRSSMVGALGPDGVVRNRTEEEGALRFIGVANEVVWFDHPQRKLHARRLPSLALVPGLTEAVAAHAVLSHRYQVIGFTDDAALLLGADGKKYALALDASIESAPGVGYTLPGSVQVTNEAPASGAAPKGDIQGLIKDHPELTHPIVVVDASGGAPLVLSDPPAILVTSFDLYKGGQSQSLHRIGLDGRSHWSVTVDKMMDAVEVDQQRISLVWVGPLAGTLSAIVQLTEYYEGESPSGHSSTHVQRLVDIDAASGMVSNSRQITREETE